MSDYAGMGHNAYKNGEHDPLSTDIRYAMLNSWKGAVMGDNTDRQGWACRSTSSP
jgi:hypothetical protein